MHSRVWKIFKERGAVEELQLYLQASELHQLLIYC